MRCWRALLCAALVAASKRKGKKRKAKALRVRTPPLERFTSKGQGCTTYNRFVRAIFEKHGVVETTTNDWDAFLPCSFTEAASEVRRVALTRRPEEAAAAKRAGCGDCVYDEARPRTLLSVDGSDALASKRTLWRSLVGAHGRAGAGRRMPPTYALSSSSKGGRSDLARFREEFVAGRTYVCKKPLERKRGLFVSRNLTALLACASDGAQVIQEWQQTLLAVAGHKLNLRVYVALVCDAEWKRAYVYDELKCLYAPEKFNSSDAAATQITSMGLTKGHYDGGLPLSVAQLRKALGAAAVDGLVADIAAVLEDALAASERRLCADGRYAGFTRAQYLGADIVVDASGGKLAPYLLEFNKGPAMRPVNDLDYRIKLEMTEDFFRLSGVLPDAGGDRRSGFTPLAAWPAAEAAARAPEPHRREHRRRR